MSLTREDILKDKELVSTLADYGFKRNNELYDSKEEAVDSFLEDYRALQSNTVSAAKFINFVNNLDDDKPDDADFKQRLSKLYKVVDEEVDEVFGDTSLGTKAKAVAEYVGYTLADPINLLGLGAGKIIAGTAGRAALKPILARAFSSKAGAVATPAVAEAAIGAGQEALVQEAEQDLGVREDKSLAEIGTAGAIGGIAGGAAGALGARFAGGKRIEEIEKIAAENLEDTVQGRGAKLDSLQSAAEKTKDDYSGSYVFLKDQTDLSDEYDSMGKITEFDRENNTAVVEFIGKKDETGTITKSINLSDAKLATEKQVKDSTDEYIKTSKKKFLDKSSPEFKEMRDNLDADGINIDSPSVQRVFSVEFTEKITTAVKSAVRENPRIKSKIDLRKTPTENIAVLFRDEQFIKDNPDIMSIFIREGIEPEDVATYITAEFSSRGKRLSQPADVQREFQEVLLPSIKKASQNLTPEQRGLLEIIKEEKLIEERMANKFNVGVDIWRSFLISQPATTMRNIIGSTLRVPGQMVETKLDNFFTEMDNKLLGYSTEVDNEYLNRSVLDLSKNLFNPEDSIPIARLIAKDFSKVDKLLFQVFDDYMPVARDELGILGKGFSTASNYLNVLNRHQDRAIKSASFLSELDAQIKTARNRGIITDKSVSGVDDILKQNKLNLLNDEMVSKALDFAYKMTYQTKRAGDDLAFGGRLVNNVQKSLNNNALLKTVIPFPNFLINSLVYTTNRSGFSLLKMGKAGRELMQRNVDDAVKNRTKLNEAQAEFDLLMQNPASANPARKAELEDTIQTISKDFAQAERSLVNLKRGIVETTEGAALLAAAIALRSERGGPEWYLVEDFEGQQRDLRPIFPLTPFLFFADLILKSFRDEPITQEYVIGGSEAVLGVTVRAGAIGNFARNGYQRLANMDNDPLAAKDLGKSIGSVLGYFLGGYATPTRPIQDIIQSATGSETVERGMQKNAFGIDFEIDSPVFQGIVDEVAKNVFRGTPFEKAVFADTPEFRTGTAEETPRPIDAPIQKQLTGAAVAPRKTRVGEELARLGIPEYKTNAGTRVPEYNYAFKKALGIASKQVVEPFLNSSRYINSSPEEKRRMLDNIFFGKNAANVPERVLDAFRLGETGKTYVNVRRFANAMVKAARPNLHFLANYRKSLSSDDFSDAAEIYKRQNPGVNIDNILTYIDEDKNREASDNQIEILKQIKSIADKRGSIGEEDFIDLQRKSRELGLTFQEGGAVNKNINNQMDELGLASEGTLVPRASTEVPVTTKDSKRVSQEEIKDDIEKIKNIGRDVAVDLITPTSPYEIKESYQQTEKFLEQGDLKNALLSGASTLLLGVGTILPGGGKLTRTAADKLQKVNPNLLQKSEQVKDELGEAIQKINTSVEPKKKVTAYKLFKQDKDGNLFPLFVSMKEGKPIPKNTWIEAQVGELAKDGKKVKSSLGPLAFRPGFHAGDAPSAKHIGGKADPNTGLPDKSIKKPNYRPDNQVWAEVEFADDVDWQTEALKRAVKKKDGSINIGTAHITDQLPKGGYYRYKTNPNMEGNWLIGGEMKIKKVLTNEEVKKINKEKGTSDLPLLSELQKTQLKQGGYVNQMNDLGF